LRKVESGEVSDIYKEAVRSLQR